MQIGYMILICAHALPVVAASWSKGYPDSCTCKETGVTASECTLFSCDCNCDITFGQCDYHCCCDPDCTTEQVGRFKSSSGGCVDLASSKASAHECYSREELKKVNPGAPLKGRSTSEDAVDELLCVVKENHNFKGEFFENAAIEPTQVFSTPKGTKKYSYDESTASSFSGSLIDAYYDQGDFIPAYAKIDNETFVQVAGGFLSVPQADFTGSCNNNYFAEFATDVKNAPPCSRLWPNTLDAFKAQCEAGSSAVASYAKDIFLLSSPSAAFTVAANRVNVSIAEVHFVDPSTGQSTDVTDMWMANDCSTLMDDINTNCLFATVASGANTCNNAILSLRYLVLHAKDAVSSIKQASVRLSITDISFAEYGGISQSQSFSIQYFDEGVTNSNAKKGLPSNRTSSGNPGYLYGLPVLYGSTNSTSSVIDQIAGGLVIQTASSTGMCPIGGVGITETTVKFGYDITTACLLTVNRSEFKNLCCEGTGSCTGESPYANSAGIPYFLIPQSGFIGIYGNANPADVSQWLSLRASSPGSTRSWTERSGTCNSLVTGVNYQFLVAYTGERKNPQNKIISVAVDYTLQDITLRTNPKDGSATQAIPFTVTANFIFKDDQSLKGYNPPRPPVLFSVPYDIFYPFGIDSSPANGMRAHLGWITIAITVVFTLWALPLF